MNKLKCAILIVFLGVTFSSCVNNKLRYFVDAPSNYNIDTNVTRGPLVIQPYDVLDIRVRDRNNALVSFFNISPIRSQNEEAYLAGYQVDQRGNIELPQIGTVSVLNLTLEQAQEIIREELSELVISPIVEVRYLSFRVNVIGEVRSPGVKTLIGEKATVLDAILNSGDITDFGNRSNIKIIRGDLNMNPQIITLDLTSISAFNSPGFNLMPNDIIYIEPVRGKNAGRIAPWLSIGVSAISATLSVIHLLRR